MKTRLNTGVAALLIALTTLFAAGCAGGAGAPEQEVVPDVMPEVTMEDTSFAARAEAEQALLPASRHRHQRHVGDRPAGLR